MRYFKNFPETVERRTLITAVVSVASTVLGLISFGLGVTIVIVTEVYNWPEMLLLGAAGMWILGAYYLVLGHDLGQTEDAESSSFRGHVETDTDQNIDANFLAA